MRTNAYEIEVNDSLGDTKTLMIAAIDEALAIAKMKTIYRVASIDIVDWNIVKVHDALYSGLTPEGVTIDELPKTQKYLVHLEIEAVPGVCLEQYISVEAFNTDDVVTQIQDKFSDGDTPYRVISIVPSVIDKNNRPVVLERRNNAAKTYIVIIDVETVSGNTLTQAFQVEASSEEDVKTKVNEKFGQQKYQLICIEENEND